MQPKGMTEQDVNNNDRFQVLGFLGRYLLNTKVEGGDNLMTLFILLIVNLHSLKSNS